MKRLLALLLVLALLLSGAAWAEEGDLPASEATQELAATPEPEPTIEPTLEPTAQPTEEPTVEPVATEAPETTEAPEATEEPTETEIPAGTEKPEATGVPGGDEKPDKADDLVPNPDFYVLISSECLPDDTVRLTARVMTSVEAAIEYTWQYRRVEEDDWHDLEEKSQFATFPYTAGAPVGVYRCVVTSYGQTAISNEISTDQLTPLAKAGTFGDGLTWSIDTAFGGLYIGGSGAMPDFSGPEDCPWAMFRSYVVSITFSRGITHIGRNAFTGCSRLTRINLPQALESIGAEAFSYCGSLKSLTFPTGLSAIGRGAFAYCGSLQSISLPFSLRSIGAGAFEECRALNDVTLLEGLNAVGERAFSGCVSLRALDLPATVTEIGRAAFCGCSSLESFVIPGGVTAIEADTFSMCGSLKTLTIPPSVTRIDAATSSGEITFSAQILCRAGSYAEQWAKAHQADYRRIGTLPRPESVSLSGTAGVRVRIGETLRLDAAVSPAYADYTLSWSSSKRRVATVSDGVVTGLSAGEVSITVRTNNGKSASLTVYVYDPLDPIGVRIAGETHEFTIYLGSTHELFYDIANWQEESCAVTWKSSNPRVATVDENGLVTPLREGTVRVTVTTVYLKRSDTVTIHVADPKKPAAVHMDFQDETIELKLGQYCELSYHLIPSTAESAVVWKSSNRRVVTVENGRVQAIGEGTATVTLTTVRENKQARIKFVVTDPHKVASLRLYPAGTEYINLGDTLQLEYRLFPETAQSEVVWKSSNPRVATVGENGLVTPLREGSTVITLTSVKQHRRDTVKIRVSDPYKPTGVTLSQTGTVTLDLDKTLELGYNLIPETAQSGVTWRSSNPRVATVENGIVTPHREGTVTITVTTAKQGRRATVKVKVVDPYKPTGVTLSQTGTVTLDLDKTLELGYNLIPETAQSDVTWRSSSKAIATVENGVVTPHREGTVTITVTTAKQGRRATVRVKVVDPNKLTALSK